MSDDQGKVKQSLLWIHCNKCFELYQKKQKRFYFLSCSHILCESCFCTAQQKNFCLFCKKEVNLKLINNQLSQQYKRFFDPQPWQNLNNVIEVIPFQMKHRDHFASGIRKIKQKCIAMEDEIKRMKEDLIKIDAIRKRKIEEALLMDKKLEKFKADIGEDSFDSQN